MIISLDTETTSGDLYHATAVYLVTFCDESGCNTWFEWDVDPETREVQCIDDDLELIQARVDEADEIVLQNPKFDVTALRATFQGQLRWGWSKVRDTLMAGHVLKSLHPHDLTSMAVEYLGVNIKKYEDRLEVAVKEARAIAKREHPAWRTAKEGLPEMPSAGSDEATKTWKLDMWLPRTVARIHEFAQPNHSCEHKWVDAGRWCGKCGGHRWWLLASDYANMDSSVTLPIYQAQMVEIERRGLMNVYRKQLELLSATYDLETRGLTLSETNMNESVTRFSTDSERLGVECVKVAKSMGYDLELPKSGNNGSLLGLCFGKAWQECEVCGHKMKADRNWDDSARAVIGACPKCLKKAEKEAKRLKQPSLFGNGSLGHMVFKEHKGLDLPRLKWGASGPSLDKEVMERYETLLSAGSPQKAFIDALRDKRKCDTALSYLNGYQRFWFPLTKGWYLLHPNLNITGTDTLRFSSRNPNNQNISSRDGFNLRYTYGPTPGREWWALDARNIERRLPAYAAGETDIIALFERPDDPPYFGSEHALVSHILFPKEFESCMSEVGLDGRLFKKKFLEIYNRVKRFDFAVQNSAQERKANATAGLPDAFQRVKGRFAKQENIIQRLLKQANKTGYIETMPDRTVDLEHGYPLMCQRGHRGEVEVTKPWSYYIQGSAMWWMRMAMIRCAAQLSEWNESTWGATTSELLVRWLADALPVVVGYFMILQVHDELLFDFPKGKGNEPWRTNLPKIRRIQRLMEEGGPNLIPAVPTPVSVCYHADNYSTGLDL